MPTLIDIVILKYKKIIYILCKVTYEYLIVKKSHVYSIFFLAFYFYVFVYNFTSIDAYYVHIHIWLYYNHTLCVFLYFVLDWIGNFYSEFCVWFYNACRFCFVLIVHLD